MNLDGLVLREALNDDYDSLRKLEQKVVDAERPYNASLKKNNVHYYDIEKLIVEQNSRLIVADMADVIIATGYVQLRQSKSSLEHERHGYLGFMYVAEEYRGLGLNKMILQDLVHWGQQQGVTDFYLDVYAENNSAVRAYEKFGFQSSLLEMKLDTKS
jgi:ribosomal protein S18 acetylase RimI-like enzyme